MFEDVQPRTDKKLPVDMRFQKTKEKKIILPFPFSIANCCVGNRHVTDTIFEMNDRPVSREIIKVTRFRELRQLNSLESCR